MAADYINDGDLRAYIGGGDALWRQLTDQGDETVIANVIGATCREAEGYLRSAGLTIPVVDTDIIGQMKLNLLRMANYALRSRNQNKLREEDTEAYKVAIAYFKGVAKREIVLARPDEGGTAPGVGEYVLDGDEGEFSRAKLGAM